MVMVVRKGTVGMHDGGCRWWMCGSIELYIHQWEKLYPVGHCFEQRSIFHSLSALFDYKMRVLVCVPIHSTFCCRCFRSMSRFV